MPQISNKALNIKKVQKCKRFKVKDSFFNV